MPKTGVVGHSSLSERHGKSNGPGTALETERLNGGTVFVLFLLHYDEHRVVATPHFSARRVQRRGRRSRGDASPGGVSRCLILSNRCLPVRLPPMNSLARSLCLHHT